jgi:hypothetical protein
MPEEAAQSLLAALEGMALKRALYRDNKTEDAVRRFRSLALHLLKPKR